MSSWKGHLRLSLVSCPVRLEVAVSESQRIRLHMLNPDTGNRVQQFYRDSETEEEVARTDTVKGYEIEKGRYLILDEKDLERAEESVSSAHVIDLETFVDREEIDDLYFDTPYWVVPDGEMAMDTYRVIAEAMKQKGRAALGRVTLSSRERPILLRPRKNGLMLTTLRSPQEVRQDQGVFGGLSDVGLDEEMVKLGTLIIEKKAGHFDPAKFEDRYQTALRAVIQARLKGTEVKIPTAKQPDKVVDLMEALRRSLGNESAGGGSSKAVKKPANDKRAPPARKPSKKASEAAAQKRTG